MQILICDDDTGTGELVAEHLNKQGIDTLVVGNGYEGIKTLAQHNIEVVISDYWMSEGDGGTVANYCHDKNIRCIIMSGASMEELRPYLPQTTLVIDKVNLLDKLSELFKIS